MKNQKLEKLFNKRYKAAKEYRKGFEPRWKELTDLYHLVDPNHPLWNFISFLRDYADSIGVRWEAGIFAGRQFFGLQGNPSKFDDNADNMAKTIQKQAEEDNGLLALLRGSLTPLSYLGNVILKAGWQGDPQAPAWDSISLLDFWPRPGSSGIDKKMGWCIYRCKYTLRELRELEESGTVTDIDAIVSYVAPQSRDKADKQGGDLVLEARGVDTNSVGSPDSGSKDDMDREYTVMHMWEKDRYVAFEETSMEIISVPDMGGGMIDKVIGMVGLAEPNDNEGWTANDYVDDKEQPYFPFVLLRPMPEKGVFYGMSPVEAHIVLQYEFNENRHQKRITVDIIKKGIWLYRRGNNIDETRLEKEAVLKGDSITDADIRRLEVGGSDILSVFERDETSIIQAGDKAAGIYDPQRGGGEGDITKTVGGLTLLVKEGNLKFARHIANIQTDGIRPLIMINVWLNQQFLGEAVVEVRDAGNPVEIPGEARQGTFSYEMTSAPGLGQQEAQQAMYSMIVDRYTNNPVLTPLVKVDELVKKELKSSDLEPEDVMWTIEERDLIAENNMLQQQIMQLTQPQVPPVDAGGGVAVPPPASIAPAQERVMI